jgi:ribosomal protein S18 acetylase RimI-like enzyme
MFAGTALAHRIERAEAGASRLMADRVVARGAVQGGFSRPFAGGAAVFTGRDAPLTKVIGVGFEQPPETSAVETIERAFLDRGAAVRYEIASLADPGWLRALTRRGYELQGFEHVLAAPLPLPAEHRVPGMTIERTTDAVAWRDALIDGFSSPDLGVASAPPEEFPRAALEETFDDMTSGPGFVMYAAYIEGQVAGAAGLRLIDGLAQLCGAATLPAWRRRGVQTALLRERLDDAAHAGCDLAVVTTQPGSKSEANANRAGFGLLYTRAVLVWPPSGGQAV